MLTPEQIKERLRVQKLSREQGNCICLLGTKCPCPFMIKKGICHCAGEHHDESFAEWAKFNQDNK